MQRAHDRTMHASFAPTRTYLDTATYGLAPEATADVVIAAERARMRGDLDPFAVDDAVAASRRMVGDLLGVPAGRVAIGAHVASLVGLVATAVPAGTVVLAPAGDFTSVLGPFLARAGDGVELRTVPVDGLLDAIDGTVDVVATSVVQSSDGTVLDPAAVIGAAHAAGARVLLDATQAAGWLPLTACAEADWVVLGGYKWLMAPRGTAFLAGTDDALDRLRPTAANWYAGVSPWQSCYGPTLTLADDARRFDTSPAWPAWLGQRTSLDLIAATGVDRIHAHDVGLANRLRAGLGLPPSDSAIVSVEVPDGTHERLARAGIAASFRAGRLRLSCHLHNTPQDIAQTLDVLTTTPTTATTARAPRKRTAA